MKLGNKEARIFKIKNRQGYAAVCCGHLTEGRTPEEASCRMVKALRRTAKRRK
jgi:hypothetical protein